MFIQGRCAPGEELAHGWIRSSLGLDSEVLRMAHFNNPIGAQARGAPRALPIASTDVSLATSECVPSQ